ncbi:cytidylyltransferase domain-containing protein [Maribacter sp. LLG6340-A2]|uniref:cytidylyltransferase domain-containing protein n=1 Tax=Maribacter sp. LLG6340-A2 TaxID=3160834 RepID=UPI00386DFCE1
MNILVVIPARGGSKGIPRKNIRSLAGKPLLYYSVRNAKKINNGVVDVYVSSEDQEILTLAKKFGAKTIQRGLDIADDKTTLDPVIYNCYLKASEIEGKNYDYVITMQPTSPLLDANSINNALKILRDKNIDTVISGIYDTHLTWIKGEKEFTPNYRKRLNRQELPQIYKETGGFVITRSVFMTLDSRFGPNTQIYPLTKKEAVDIDDFEDWNICEYYLNKKKILFVICGNSSVGMGHVYNSLSIANEILDHQICFLTDNKSTLAFDKIKENNYEVFAQKKENILEDIKDINPDIVINDILDTTSEYIDSLKKYVDIVINFEDLGKGSQLADLVINAMYPEGKVNLGHYYGSKYFILRDEFLYTKEKLINSKLENILISFGGVDPNNYTDRILSLISSYCKEKGIVIKVITGLGYQHYNDLIKKYPHIPILKNVLNMSEEIYQADLIFTSAGRTTFEVAAIGVPAIVLCQNERETSHFFASEKNGFFNLGLGYQISDEKIQAVFERALDFNIRMFMHERLLETDLKNGKKRVIDLIKKTINNFV